MVGNWNDIPPPPKMAMADNGESILTLILDEQRETNRLLAALVEALADAGQETDAMGPHYLDGSRA